MREFLLKPAKLMVCELENGHPVRVVNLDSTSQKVRVVSLRTGLPFQTTRDQLYNSAHAPQ